MGDRYEIVRRIADGGLGTVFEAYDHELKRNVALKRLKFSLLGANERDSEAATQRLLEEATSMSSLNHPNIVSVYDAGHDENGSFMVMELLQGETLGETITRGTLTREDFEQLAAQTMDGLMAAEAASIVHCDLKPSNIMVVWQPSDRFLIKILDFGLAKVPQRPRRSATSQDSVLMGSIRFLAPEQIEKKEPTFLSDLYSMGCVYYYSLSGAYPFDGTSMVGVMQAHLNNQVRPLSELRPDLPIEVATWVMRLLNRAPNQRPQSARDALESFPFEHGTHQPYFTPPRQPTPQEVTEAPMLMPEPEPPRSLPAAPQFSGPVQDAYPIIVAESAPTTAPAWSSPRKISSFASRYLIGLATVCAIFFLALVSAFVWRNPLPQGPAATASPDITALTSEESSVPEPIPPDPTPLSIASSREPAQELTREPILAPSPPRLLPPPIAADEIPTYVWQLRRAVPEDRQLLLTQVRTLEEDRLYLEIWDALFIQEGIASDFELAQDIVEVRPPSRRSQDASLLMARIRTTEDMAKRSFLLRVLCRYPSLSEEVMVQLLDKGWKSEDLAHLEARLITHWRMRPIEGRDKALLGRLSQAQDMSYHSLSRVAGAVGGDAIFRHLEGHLGSPDPNEQRDALSALAHWRNRAPLPLIQDYLNTSPEDDLRQLATHAFLRLLAHPEPSLGEGWSTVLPYLQTKKEQNRFLKLLTKQPLPRGAVIAEESAASLGGPAENAWQDIKNQLQALSPLGDSGFLALSEARLLRNPGGIRLSPGSALLSDWKDPETYISWPILIDQPGVYEVKLEYACGEFPFPYQLIVHGPRFLQSFVPRKTETWDSFHTDVIGTIAYAAKGPSLFTLAAGTSRVPPQLINIKSLQLSRISLHSPF